MEPQYDSWLMASHHTVAACIDCHLPHGGLEKWMAKADNGYRHSRGFTLQDFHEPILMTGGNERILQENCLRCHADLVHDLVVTAAEKPGEEARCVRCHRTVGHGEPLGLGGPERASTDLNP